MSAERGARRVADQRVRVAQRDPGGARQRRLGGLGGQRRRRPARDDQVQARRPGPCCASAAIRARSAPSVSSGRLAMTSSSVRSRRRVPGRGRPGRAYPLLGLGEHGPQRRRDRWPAAASGPRRRARRTARRPCRRRPRRPPGRAATRRGAAASSRSSTARSRPATRGSRASASIGQVPGAEQRHDRRETGVVERLRDADPDERREPRGPPSGVSSNRASSWPPSQPGVSAPAAARSCSARSCWSRSSATAPEHRAERHARRHRRSPLPGGAARRPLTARACVLDTPLTSRSVTVSQRAQNVPRSATACRTANLGMWPPYPSARARPRVAPKHPPAAPAR